MEEATAQRQMAFDQVISRILARFATAGGYELDDHINVTLGEIASFVGVEYSFLVLFSDDLTTWSATHEWCAPGIPSNLKDYQEIPFGTVQWVERLLLGGEDVVLNSLRDLPCEAGEERKRWEGLGIKSTLHLPLRGKGGKVKGCVSLNATCHEVTWAKSDVTRLTLVGEAIANAIERARAERALQQSEARFRATFEQAPVGILNVARDGKLLRANQRFCDFLGYTHEEILGRHYADFTHPDDVHATESLYDNLLVRQESVPALEKRYLRKDGQVVWGTLTMSPLVNDDVGQEGLVAIIEDITARKQAEETFDAVPDLIFVCDQHGRIIRVNLATVRRLGMTREEVLGRPCCEIIRDETDASESPRKGCSDADGRSHHIETHQPHLGGDFLLSRTPLYDARGELKGTVCVARDVTELRRSAEALRRAHKELAERRALVAAASLDGVWEWDAGTDQVQYSERFAELLGYNAAEVPQTLEFFRSILHPDDAGILWDAVDRHLSEGAEYDVECRLSTKDGAYRWFRTRGRAHRDQEGSPTWMAGSLQDIDKLKMTESDLRNALWDVQQLTQQLRAENIYLQEEISSSLGFDEIVGESDALCSMLQQVDHVARTDASVLLLGETGTGKELLARAVHERSERKQRPLVKVNLAALPSSLIESELFGHVKGAFTGAVADKLGRFQLADGGTLFLDEIGELDPELQTKLLRVLQEGEFERIGSGETIRVDVRLVAATNRDLRRAMEENKFRPDLFYRLAVFPIEVPPLRLRRDDIPLLTWHFIGKKQGRLGKAIKSIPEKVMKALVEYDWPGNIRELENVIERAMILSSGIALSLPEPLKPIARPAEALTGRGELDRGKILAALETSNWKVKGAGNAADRLGLKPSTLRYRMKALGIQRPAET